MKPNWQQQQEQMRQQQEQMRQQQMRGAWEQQRKQGREQTRHPFPSQTADGFSEVETAAARLIEQSNSGALSQEQLNLKLKELMIQDKDGKWWMIGAKTRLWHYYNGKTWIQAHPPGHSQRTDIRENHEDAQVRIQKKPFRSILISIGGLVVAMVVLRTISRGAGLIEILIAVIAVLVVTWLIRRVWKPGNKGINV